MPNPNLIQPSYNYKMYIQAKRASSVRTIVTSLVGTIPEGNKAENKSTFMSWFIVRAVLQRSQSGWSSLVSMYFCVIFVCLIIILDITTWSRLFRVGGITFL